MPHIIETDFKVFFEDDHHVHYVVKDDPDGLDLIEIEQHDSNAIMRLIVKPDHVDGLIEALQKKKAEMAARVTANHSRVEARKANVA